MGGKFNIENLCYSRHTLVYSITLSLCEQEHYPSLANSSLFKLFTEEVRHTGNDLDCPFLISKAEKVERQGISLICDNKVPKARKASSCRIVF